MNDETIPMTDNEDVVSPGFSRRSFLVAGGVTAAAVAATPYLGKVAFAGASTSTSTGTKAASAKGANKDLATAAFAASLEALAVSTYRAAVEAATAGKLGAVPPVGPAYLQTAISQHTEQLAKWNSVLAANGKPEVTEPNAKLKTTVDARFADVTDFGGAVTLARDLEEIAAATYLSAIPTLKSKDAIELAGSINIIDMQHVAILNYVLGEYPVPDTFAKTTKAATP